MGSFSAIPDLSTGDLVSEAYLDALRANDLYLLNPNHQVSPNSTFVSTTGTTYSEIAGASAVVTAHGGPIMIGFNANLASAANGNPILDVTVDGASLTTNSGIYSLPLAAIGVSFTKLVTGQASGVHTFKLVWKTLAGTHTGAISGHREFMAIEL